MTALSLVKVHAALGQGKWDTAQRALRALAEACGCGFPRITLSGTPGDWALLRRKAEQLRAYDLDWWLAALLPALDEFVAMADERDPRDYEAACKPRGKSKL